MKNPVIHHHRGDLPADVKFSNVIAVDTETMGLNMHRDPLCVVQLSDGDGEAHVVQMAKNGYELDGNSYDAPNLKALLADTSRLKIFHYARFDVAILRKYLHIECSPIYCTRTVSRLIRTYTDRHGLRECCRDLLKVDINKQQQSTDWGAENLSKDQLLYAATDVLHLHALKDKMDIMLKRADRTELAQKCFDFIPVRAELDQLGWGHQDIFEH